MQSLSIYARLFARALSSVEAESIILNSLLRLSSSSSPRAAITTIANRLAITYPTSVIERAVHLVTVSSGYSGDQRNFNSEQNISSSLTHRQNVFGDDAFFITKHRLGDFLGNVIDDLLFLVLFRYFRRRRWCRKLARARY